MIPFFRKIRWRLAADNQPASPAGRPASPAGRPSSPAGRFLTYSRYAIGEIVLVVVGILIALQVNNWNEDKNTRKTELKLLKELRTDLEETKIDLLTDIEKTKARLKETDSLYQLITSGNAQNNPKSIELSMQFILDRSDLFPKKSAYESLQSFGINLVSNDFLRKRITDFYELQLVRLEGLEKFIKETHEKELAPYLMKVSKPTADCDGCKSLKELFAQSNAISSNFYLVEAPNNELVHHLKLQYLAYSALEEQYTAIEETIDDLIGIIDTEINL